MSIEEKRKLMSHYSLQFAPLLVREHNEELVRELRRMEDRRAESRANEASVKQLMGRTMYRRDSGKSS
jgi:hypothetical protein